MVANIVTNNVSWHYSKAWGYLLLPYVSSLNLSCLRECVEKVNLGALRKSISWLYLPVAEFGNKLQKKSTSRLEEIDGKSDRTLETRAIA